MLNHTTTLDLVIIGGGIAGLWTLTQARQAGYSAILLEHQTLGSEQTIASQGMIHGGVKYALSGQLSNESEAIANMPALWERCLAGEGDIDLSQTHVLSRDFYLWSSGLVGRLGSFFASKALRGRVDTLARNQFPSVLQHPSYKGNVYRLVDCVVDVPSLLNNLLRLNAEHIFKIDWRTCHWDIENHALAFDTGLRIQAQRFIFSAGQGNADLLADWGEKTPQMQLRPLQQVLVKHELKNASLFGHCMGSQLQASPRLSISTHTTQDEKTVWYLGGDLATTHAQTDAGILIDNAKRELSAIFPWLDFKQAQWATLFVNRAEPKQAQLLKPDNAFVQASTQHPLITAWPTKLTLAPDMSQRVLSLLTEQSIKPQATNNIEKLKHLARPCVACAPWDNLF